MSASAEAVAAVCICQTVISEPWQIEPGVAASSAGVLLTAAPIAVSRSTAASFVSHTTSRTPARKRLLAMWKPMVPMPINPTTSACDASALSVSD